MRERSVATQQCIFFFLVSVVRYFYAVSPKEGEQKEKEKKRGGGASADIRITKATPIVVLDHRKKIENSKENIFEKEKII